MRIADEVPNLLINGWFLDDGTLAGRLADLTRASEILIQGGPARGLILYSGHYTQEQEPQVLCLEP